MLDAGILKNCRTKLKNGESIKKVVSYLFSISESVDEADVLAYFEKLGVEKRVVKEVLVYDFGLDFETIMIM